MWPFAKKKTNPELFRDVMPLVMGFLQMHDQIRLMKVSKDLNQLCLNCFHTLVLPNYFSRDGGEWLEETELKPLPEPDLKFSPPVRCLSSGCEFYGSAENKGFCSSCARTQKLSNDTLETWLAKSEKLCIPLREAKINEWNAETVRRREVFKRAQALGRFLAKIDTLHSVMILQIYDRTFPLSFQVFQERFSHSLRCLCLPNVSLSDDMLFTISKNFAHLMHIDISQPRFSKSNFSTEAILSICHPRLEHLNIAYCIKQPKEFCAKLPEMPRLKALSIAGFCMSPPYALLEISEYFAKCPNLEALDLRDNRAKLIDLHTLALELKLRFLDLREFKYTTKPTNHMWTTKLPKLEALVISKELDPATPDHMNPRIEVYVTRSTGKSALQNFLPCSACALNTETSLPLKAHIRKGRRDPKKPDSDSD